MRNYLIEFLGTLFLVLIIGLSNNPVAIGFGLTVLVYMGAHISGAHYNPVVTIAFLIKKEINLYDSFFYIFFQSSTSRSFHFFHQSFTLVLNIIAT